MEALYLYLLKSSGLLALFFMAYHFLLRKETFFTNNRWFLLLGLVTASILPLVVYTQIIWIDPAPVAYDWSSLPVRQVTPENHTKEYVYLGLALLYSLITLGLLIKFILDFYSLRAILKGKAISQQADFKFIDATENIAPFSYFNTIVYNSSLYTATELENILEHEKVHCDQNHTIDVLLARVYCAIFWFNPFIWWYKKAILQNLEFIADSEATKKISDKKAYQLTLLKITTHENCVSLTNHFYQSLIKKRIVMLNKNQSKKWNSWKYATILPALVAFVLCFQIEVVAQEKAKVEVAAAQTNTPISVVNATTLEKDSIKKIKTLFANSSKNKGIDENTEIFINGKKVSQKELDNTNPDDIATMDVIKNNNESSIQIITKEKTTGNTRVFNSDVEKADLELDNADPKNVTIHQKSKDHYTVTKISTEVNGVPRDAEYFIDGKKVSPLEAESMNPNQITSVDVKKNGVSDKNSVRILTKSYYKSKGSQPSYPTPPTPPTPPKFTLNAPTAPNFPTPPKAPKGSPEKGSKKEWAAFEQKMSAFNKKMEAMEPQMKEFDKKMAEFDEQMKPFDAKMKIFEKNMKIYEKQMEEYREKMNENK